MVKPLAASAYVGPAQEELTPQQLRFVQEYMICGNARKAAYIAGYSVEHSSHAGSKLLRDPKIQVAIQEAKDKQAQRTGIDADRVLQELAKIAFADIGTIVSLDPETGDTTVDFNKITKEGKSGALAELSITTTGGRNKTRSIKVRPFDKQAALMAIGKHLGMFKERIEVTAELSLLDLITQSMDTKVLPPPNDLPEIVQEEEGLEADSTDTSS